MMAIVYFSPSLLYYLSQTVFGRYLSICIVPITALSLTYFRCPFPLSGLYMIR